MEANAIADTLIEKFGKQMVFSRHRITFTAMRCKRHSSASCATHGGTWAGDRLAARDRRLFPIAAATRETIEPHVLIDLMGGEDQVEQLAQIVRFGLNQDMAVGGALFELESILAVPDTARIGWWTMEWWWDQPDMPEVKAFDAAIRRRTGKAASARNWFGYAAVQALARYCQSGEVLGSGRARPRAAGLHVAC